MYLNWHFFQFYVAYLFFLQIRVAYFWIPSVPCTRWPARRLQVIIQFSFIFFYAMSKYKFHHTFLKLILKHPLHLHPFTTIAATTTGVVYSLKNNIYRKKWGFVAHMMWRIISDVWIYLLQQNLGFSTLISDVQNIFILSIKQYSKILYNSSDHHNNILFSNA